MKRKDFLEINNLYATTSDGKSILNGVNLNIKKGEVHILMGPNGSGKSSLALVLMGSPKYIVTKGKITLNGKDLTKLPPNIRAKEGLFLAFQYPVEVNGVNFAGYLRMAVKERTQIQNLVSPIVFRKNLSENAKKLDFFEDISVRSLNEGFSGGEKKKSEILQLLILKPKFAILDEPDSGLDVDAVKYVIKAIASLNKNLGVLIITHYQRILNYIKPDKVHLFVGGKIIKTGDIQLAREIEKNGYESYINTKT